MRLGDDVRIRQLPETFAVLGIRKWRLSRSSELISPVHDFMWSEGVNIRECMHTRRYGEDVRCTGSCGFYATPHYDVAFPHRGEVWGVIAGWGQVGIGSEAWRSQYAAIRAVYSPREFLRKYPNVPHVESLRQLISEFLTIRPVGIVHPDSTITRARVFAR